MRAARQAASREQYSAFEVEHCLLLVRTCKIFIEAVRIVRCIVLLVDGACIKLVLGCGNQNTGHNLSQDLASLGRRDNAGCYIAGKFEMWQDCVSISSVLAPFGSERNL